MTLSVEPLNRKEWPAVRAIYSQGIATGQATFQTEPGSWESWDSAHLSCCRLLLRREHAVVAWAALSPVSVRPVYRGVAEVSIYVAAAARGEGLGRALLRALTADSEENGLWTLQAGIFPENHASLALHESCGFRVVGVRERLGMLHGAWRDVLLLERRSTRAG